MRSRLGAEGAFERIPGAGRGRSRATFALLLAAAVTVAVPVLAGAGEQGLTPGRDTMKSRLSDKASDDQRRNDCGVPEDRRGDRRRPTACGAKRAAAGSGERRLAQ